MTVETMLVMREECECVCECVFTCAGKSDSGSRSLNQMYRSMIPLSSSRAFPSSSSSFFRFFFFFSLDVFCRSLFPANGCDPIKGLQESGKSDSPDFEEEEKK